MIVSNGGLNNVLEPGGENSSDDSICLDNSTATTAYLHRRFDGKNISKSNTYQPTTPTNPYKNPPPVEHGGVPRL